MNSIFIRTRGITFARKHEIVDIVVSLAKYVEVMPCFAVVFNFVRFIL